VTETSYPPVPDGVDPEPLLRPDQVCDWWQISRDLLYDLVQQGRIPHVRVGGRQLRFHRVELDEYLADRHKGGAE
jgi:excisionase family DNA binding protein